jgi:hypothetical protein
MASYKTTCPVCGEPMKLIGGNVVKDYFPNRPELTGVPLLVRHKFHASELKYFEEELPNIGDNIMLVWSDYHVTFNFVWSEREINGIEIGHLVNIAYGPVPLSWKLM